MAQYTVQDIEIIRQKSGISYEEAVNLLEYHNGSLARSLVDLEKNGRIKKSEAHAADSGKGLFNFLFRLRLKVSKNNVTVLNLSSIFMIISLCVAPHLLIIGLVASLFLGYRINMERNSREFEKDSFDTIVKNAKTNVQSTVTGFTSVFTHVDGQAQSKQAQSAANGAQVSGDTSAQPQAEQPQPVQRNESAPSGTRPVNVQFSEGASADVRSDEDGYYEVDIK